MPDTTDDPAELRCACGARLRPHVLWFDECYDEPLYRYDSTLAAARRAALLLVIGTSGATSLPTRVCELVATRGAPLVVVDPAPTPFSALAESSPTGLFLPGTACALVPGLTAQIAGAVGP
jgi:NAD-dependent deacetylase